jgi:hypothetical protein
MYPQYLSYHQPSPFNNLRQPSIPNPNLTISPTSSFSNLKTTRSPSLSPSSSSPDEDKFYKEDIKRNKTSLSPGFPRHSSIDSISSKFNKSAKIDTTENEHSFSKMNDENNNPLKIRARSPSLLMNDKNIPHNCNSLKYNQHFISQQQQQQQHQIINNKLALSSGILNNNNKECNKSIRLDNNDITSSTLTIKPSNSNNSSNSGSNSSINNITSNSNNNNNNNNGNTIFIPPCTSNGISLELREKLRQNILKKQDKNKYVKLFN